MVRPNLELADIFRRHGEAWRAANAGHVNLAQRRVMTAIEICRTAALGGHVERCQDCGQIRIAPAARSAPPGARDRVIKLGNARITPA
jgi:hypothetical protein